MRALRGADTREPISPRPRLWPELSAPRRGAKLHRGRGRRCPFRLGRFGRRCGSGRGVGRSRAFPWALARWPLLNCARTYYALEMRGGKHRITKLSYNAFIQARQHTIGRGAAWEAARERGAAHWVRDRKRAGAVVWDAASFSRGRAFGLRRA